MLCVYYIVPEYSEAELVLSPVAKVNAPASVRGSVPDQPYALNVPNQP